MLETKEAIAHPRRQCALMMQLSRATAMWLQGKEGCETNKRRVSTFGSLLRPGRRGLTTTRRPLQVGLAYTAGYRLS
jgi:hypothetical protein